MINVPKPLKSLRFITSAGIAISAVAIVVGAAGGIGDYLSTKSADDPGAAALLMTYMMRWGTPIVGGMVAAASARLFLSRMWREFSK